MTLFCSFLCWMKSLRPLRSAGGHCEEDYGSASCKAEPGDVSVYKVLEGLALVLWALLSCRFSVSWKSYKNSHLLLYPSFSNLKHARSCSTTVQWQSNEHRENSLCTDVTVLCNQQTFYKQNWFSSSGLNYRMLGKEEQLTGGCSQVLNIYSL